MISKEAFKNLVDVVAQKTGKTQEELAIEMGYGKNYISELTTPSGTVSKKFLQAFKMKHRDILENPKNGKAKALVEDVSSLESPDNSTLLRILDNLSAAHREISESNNKLADNEKMILMKMPTAGSQIDMPSDELATIQGIRGLLIEFYADVKKTTLQEAESVLGTKVVAAKKKVGKKDILSGGGR